MFSILYENFTPRLKDDKVSFDPCEVTVPFASIMLENCMPLLGARGSWNPATALPGPPGFLRVDG